MITMKKPLAQRRRRLFHPRYNGTDCNLRKINASQRLIDLQRPMLACLGIDMIPVVKTKRHVAVFLYFKNHNVVQGVDGSRLHQDSVARLWREATPGGPRLSRLQWRREDYPPWCRPSGPRRYGFRHPLPGLPTLRFFPSPPAESVQDAHQRDGPGRRGPCVTSRNFNSRGNREKCPANPPMSWCGHWSSSSLMVFPLSGPSATRLGWSSRSLKIQASPIGPSPGSGAERMSARRRPPQSRYW